MECDLANVCGFVGREIAVEVICFEWLMFAVSWARQSRPRLHTPGVWAGDFPGGVRCLWEQG
jgi:hypothetical protein